MLLDREVSLHTGNGNAKAQAILSGPYNCSLDGSTLKKAMSSPKAAGRMALWAIKLSEFDIQYRPQIAIKG